MKNIITIPLFLIALVLGYYTANHYLSMPQPTPEQIKQIKIDRLNLETIVYDDCEYIFFSYYHSAGLAHKGNCKNPQH